MSEKEYAIERGKQFLNYFEQADLRLRKYHGIDETVLTSLERIWNEICGLQIIDENKTVRIINNLQLVGWFFLAGLDPKGMESVLDERMEEDYDRLVMVLLLERANGSYPCVENALRTICPSFTILRSNNIQ